MYVFIYVYFYLSSLNQLKFTILFNKLNYNNSKNKILIKTPEQKNILITDGRDKPNSKPYFRSYNLQVPLETLPTNGKLKFDSNDNDSKNNQSQSSGNNNDNNNNECDYNNVVITMKIMIMMAKIIAIAVVKIKKIFDDNNNNNNNNNGKSFD